MGSNEFELHALVYGHVQGVRFRATVNKYAEKIGLSGTVKNLSNGSVEIYAQGNKAALKLLLDEISKDPGYGRVDRIEQKIFASDGRFEGFIVL